MDLAPVLAGLPEDAAERIRVAAERARRELRARPRPITRECREIFLASLTAGLAVDDAAAAADRSIGGFYAMRDRDPEFARRWADAIEASCGGIERALEDTLHRAPLDSMARVRAAEVLLKTRHPAHRSGSSQQQRAQAKIESAGGSMSVSIGMPGPD